MADSAISQSVTDYVAVFRSNDSLERSKARGSLVEMGHDAVPALAEALTDSDQEMRWEAATALLEINDPSAAPALAEALNDEKIAVRWLASDALIRLGDVSLPSVLKGLRQHSESPNFREAAERVLSHLGESPKGRFGAVLDPVLEALNNVAAGETTPGAATRALEVLQRDEVHLLDDDGDPA